MRCLFKKEEEGFNPLKNCATIAFACNLKHQRTPLVIEPMNGWRGANVNQSHIALEWLCYEDSNLGRNRIRHVRNGGEQKVITQQNVCLWMVMMHKPRKSMSFMGVFSTGV